MAATPQNRATLEFVQGEAAATLVIYQGAQEMLRRGVPLDRVVPLIDQLRAGADGGASRASADWHEAPRLLLSPTHAVMMQGRMMRVLVRFPEEARRLQHMSHGTRMQTIPARWWVITYRADDVSGEQRIQDCRFVVELPGQEGTPSITRLVAAWPFANVYDGTAAVCWGGNRAPTVGSPIDVDALFFGSPFNTDLMSRGVAARHQAIWRGRSLARVLAPVSAENPGVSVEAIFTGDASDGVPHAMVRGEVAGDEDEGADDE